MRCPGCGNANGKVIVESVCVQTATLDDNDQIVEYGGVDEIGRTLTVSCYGCGVNLRFDADSDRVFPEMVRDDEVS